MSQFYLKRNISYLRALLYSRQQRIPKSILLCSFNTAANELIINRFFHKNPWTCYTTLSLVVEQTNMCKFHSGVHCKGTESSSGHKLERLHHKCFTNICLSILFHFLTLLFLWHFKTQIFIHSLISRPTLIKRTWCSRQTHIQLFCAKCRFNVICPINSTKRNSARKLINLCKIPLAAFVSSWSLVR